MVSTRGEASQSTSLATTTTTVFPPETRVRYCLDSSKLQGSRRKVFQVQDVQAAFRRHPEPAEIVLHHVAHEIAFDRRIRGIGKGEQFGAVVTAQPAAARGNPEETGLVHEQVVHEITGQAVFHIKDINIIFVFETLLRSRPSRQQEQKEYRCGNCFYTCIVHLSTFSMAKICIFEHIKN